MADRREAPVGSGSESAGSDASGLSSLSVGSVDWVGSVAVVSGAEVSMMLVAPGTPEEGSTKVVVVRDSDGPPVITDPVRGGLCIIITHLQHLFTGEGKISLTFHCESFGSILVV